MPLFFTRLLVLVLAGVGLAAATVAPAAAATPCWKLVLDDWNDNSRLDRTYRPRCYDQALANLPEDLRAYSDAVDVIENARQSALRRRIAVNRGPATNSGGSSGPTSGRGDAGGSRVPEARNAPDDPRGDGPLSRALRFGPNKADSVPLPLLILAAAALVLLAGGAAGLLSRRLRARRLGA